MSETELQGEKKMKKIEYLKSCETMTKDITAY